MRLRGITLDNVNASLHRVNNSTSTEGVRYAGNVNFNLTSQSGVRKPTVVGTLDVTDRKGAGATRYGACWHAYRDVIRDLLAHHPELVITTGLARYDAATFERTYPYTDPGRTLRDRCKCERNAS